MNDKAIFAAIAAGSDAVHTVLADGSDEWYTIAFDLTACAGGPDDGLYHGGYYRHGDVIWTWSQRPNSPVTVAQRQHPADCPCGEIPANALATRIADIREMHTGVQAVSSLAGIDVSDLRVTHHTNMVEASVFAGTTIPDGMSASS